MAKNTAELLHENREKILSQWQERAYQEVSATLNQTSLALQNSIPLFLDEIQEKLIHIDQKESLEGFGKEHGIIRARTINYSIDQVIYEYHILREVIFEVLEAKTPLEKKERDLVISMIEQAVNYSATSFSDTLRAIREQFASTLAHDLKTPVTSAMMDAQMILRKSNDSEYGKKKGDQHHQQDGSARSNDI